MSYIDLSYVDLNLVSDEEVVYQPKESKIRLIIPAILLIFCLFIGYKGDSDSSFNYYGVLDSKKVEVDGSGAVVNGIKHKNVSSKVAVSTTSGSLSFLDSFNTEEDFLLFLKKYMPLVLYIFGFLCLLPFFSYVNQEMAFTNKRIIIKRGTISTHTDEMMLNQVEGIKLKKGLIGGIFGFGDVIISGNGGKKIVFRDVVKPEYLKNSVFGDAVNKSKIAAVKPEKVVTLNNTVELKQMQDALSEYLKID